MDGIVEGIFQDIGQVNGAAAQVNPSPGQSYDPSIHTSPGDLQFKDIDGNGVIDVNDRVFLGSYIPDFTYAFTVNANYKNFDFSVFFQGVQGNKIFNATRVITEGMVRFFNAGTEVLKHGLPVKQIPIFHALYWAILIKMPDLPLVFLKMVLICA